MNRTPSWPLSMTQKVCSRRYRLRLAKARAIKTGMMQELLTGRTRVPIQEAAA